MKMWALCIVLLAQASWAHQASTSYVTLQQNQLSWDVDVIDLNLLVPLDSNADGQILYGELLSSLKSIDEKLLKGLQVAHCTLVPVNKTLSVVARNQSHFVRWNADLNCENESSEREVAIAAPFEVDALHRVLLRASGSDDVHIFSSGKRQQLIPLRSRNLTETLKVSLAEGVHHIAQGYDHLAFLFALLLPSVLRKKSEQLLTLKQCLVAILKVVTAFTLAHSITLALAAFDVVTPNLPRVELLIALSVALAALVNLLQLEHQARWPLAFSLGLLHGFGFVSALNELGTSGTGRAVALFGFNMGVELGQLVIVSLFVPVAFYLRETKLYQVGFLKIGSAAILGLGLFWVVQRM
jgi:hypothetical protein